MITQYQINKLTKYSDENLYKYAHHLLTSVLKLYRNDLASIANDKQETLNFIITLMDNRGYRNQTPTEYPRLKLDNIND